ncbi:biotin transporter BioY [Citricoccus muralis]|uniref:Biotin transporter n=2 Tax=Citricoccus muralis TaxID=169134 RepID=A0ABY8H6T0_9MICC|nr:biotin transporter BioY [Citricoccus muralis]WFP16390.1 biotin transporter BioY [Citricoccus muralis]
MTSTPQVPETTADSTADTTADATAGAGRAVAQVAVFAALIAALGLMGTIPVPGLVPITAQTLGVMLAGAVLGPWRGAGAVMLLLGLVAVGLPVLSGGRGGLGVFLGPSVGYLIGWIAGAIVIGLIVHGARRSSAVRPTWLTTIVGCVVGGILVIYAFGIPAQALVTGLGMWETALTSLAFLPGDLIKVVLAAVVTMALWRAYPRAFGRA